MSYCNDCGTENNDSSRFCSDCGSRIGSSASGSNSNSDSNESRNITIGRILAWVVGLVLVMNGLMLAVGAPGTGIAVFLIGVFVLPATRDSIKKRSNVGFSRWIVVIVAMIGISLAASAAPTLFGTPVDATQGGSQAGAGVAVTQTAASPTPAQTAATSAGTATATRTTTSSPTAQGPPVHAINESFLVGTGPQRINYLVYDSYVYETIGSGYSTVEADGKFVVVDIGMIAAGDESVTISSSQFTLVDEQGREYDVDSDALLATDYNIIFEQLDPGVAKSGVLIFDVPEDQTSRQLKIEPAGLFSTDEPHYVQLNE